MLRYAILKAQVSQVWYLDGNRKGGLARIWGGLGLSFRVVLGQLWLSRCKTEAAWCLAEEALSHHSIALALPPFKNP